MFEERSDHPMTLLDISLGTSERYVVEVGSGGLGSYVRRKTIPIYATAKNK